MFGSAQRVGSRKHNENYIRNLGISNPCKAYFESTQAIAQGKPTPQDHRLLGSYRLTI